MYIYKASERDIPRTRMRNFKLHYIREPNERTEIFVKGMVYKRKLSEVYIYKIHVLYGVVCQKVHALLEGTLVFLD